MKDQDPQWASAFELAKLTGCGRQHVGNWCETDSVPTKQGPRGTLYARERAIAAIDLHRTRRRIDPPGPPAGVQFEHLRQTLRALTAGSEALEQRITRLEFGLTEPQAAELLQAIGAIWSQARACLPSGGKEGQ